MANWMPHFVTIVTLAVLVWKTWNDRNASEEIRAAKDAVIESKDELLRSQKDSHAELIKVKDERLAHLERVIEDLRERSPLVIIEEAKALQNTYKELHAAAKAELKAKDDEIERLTTVGTEKDAEVSKLRSERDELKQTLDKFDKDAPSELAPDWGIVLSKAPAPYRVANVVNTASNLAALSGVTFDPDTFKSNLEATARYQDEVLRRFGFMWTSPEDRKAIEDAAAKEAEEFTDALWDEDAAAKKADDDAAAKKADEL